MDFCPSYLECVVTWKNNQLFKSTIPLYSYQITEFWQNQHSFMYFLPQKNELEDSIFQINREYKTNLERNYVKDLHLRSSVHLK